MRIAREKDLSSTGQSPSITGLAANHLASGSKSYRAITKINSFGSVMLAMEYRSSCMLLLKVVFFFFLKNSKLPWKLFQEWDINI